MNTFLNILSSGAEFLQKFFTNKINKYQDEENKKKQLVQQEFINQTQLQLQYALIDVFSQTNISSQLSSIQSMSDILPYGYQIVNNTVIYRFLWTTSSNDIEISINRLSYYTKKMNIAIANIRQKYYYSTLTMDEYQKCIFIKNNPAIYNGFHVIDCKKNVESIILSVVFDS